MNTRLFIRAAVAQGLLIAALFAVLLMLPLPKNFFKEWGEVVGPAAWIICSLAAGRLLELPLRRVAVASAAGGLAAGVLGIAGSHALSLPVAVAVFAAICASRSRRLAPAPK